MTAGSPRFATPTVRPIRWKKSRKASTRWTIWMCCALAVGTTDLLFAVDSIPAIFGLTKEPYLVLTANAFALMGLRQLFFLVGGLLDRLVHLSKGLAVVLAFIGLKLILEAMHHHGVPWAPEIPIVVSLGVIVVTLAITTMWSLRTSRRAARAAVEEAEAQRSQRVEGAQP